MRFTYNDGGRAKAGYEGKTGDCVTRAIAITSGLPYEEVYKTLHRLNKEYADTHRCQVAKKIKSGKGRRGTTPRNGVFSEIYRPYLESLGYEWVPTMKVGGGCKVHLKEEELPKGTLIVRVSRHLTSVIDGVIHDTYDPSRCETRCVYGYYKLKK